MASAILCAADDGDPVAVALIADQAEAVAQSVRAGVRRAGLGPGYPLVLAGGLFRHDSTTLIDALSRSLPDARPRVTTLEPAAGAARMAARTVGFSFHADVSFGERLDGAEIVSWRDVLDPVDLPAT